MLSWYTVRVGVFFLILRRKLLQRDRTFIQFPIPVTLTGGFVNQNR